MEKFRELKVWQKAHQLVLGIYRLTKNYPLDERYGLVSQMRRAAVSVPANIVEGTKRATVRDRKNFHVIASTSLEELKYYIMLSEDLKFLTSQDSQKLYDTCREVGAMLNALNNTLT